MGSSRYILFIKKMESQGAVDYKQTKKKIGLINQYVHKVKLRHWSERMLLLCVFFAIIIDSFDLIFTCFLFFRVNKVVSNMD